jgi:hypothetical protein
MRNQGSRRRRAVAALLGIGAAAALALGGCGGDGENGRSSRQDSGTIPQPSVEGYPTAPKSKRVDLSAPSFSDPTSVTNPLFPVSSQESVLLLGTVDGQPFRTEVTLLPTPRIFEWNGQRVATLVSQYVAYLGGRIHEVAYDHYAQDDNGAVWYFGEDVFNFKDGFIADTHGTWFAGKDGPAAMIMPADPKVGDVYRSENIPGLVFEEVTVKAVDRTLDGPLGPVEGGLLVSELHMDGQREEKEFGPGYGEFFTGGGGDVEALALAVPTDALPGPIPKELVTLETGATDAFDGAGSKKWSMVRSTVEEMTTAWDTVRQGEVPDRLGPRMSAALDSLAAAVRSSDAHKARQAAIEVAQWSLDLQLRYRPATEVDLARFGLWAAQLELDAERGNPAAVNGDFFTLGYIKDRIQQALNAGDLTRLYTELEELGGAVGDEALGAAADAARQLRATIADVQSPS